MIGTTSRPATSSSRGSTSWRTRVAAEPGSSLVGSCSGVRRSASQRAAVSARRRPSSGRRWPLPDAGQARAARAPQQVQHHGLGQVVAGVPGEHVGGQRAVPGGPGPGLQVRPRQHRHPLGPEAGAVALRRPPRPGRPRPPEPGRRPWSTWMAVTSQPAAVARTSRASESAPPDTAQVTGGARFGERAASEAGPPREAAPADAQAAASGRSGPARCPVRGSRPGWAACAGPPTPGRGPRAADLLDRGDELLALLVLVSFASRPIRRWISLARPLACWRRWRRTRPNRVGRGDLVRPGPVHGHVAVALEQAHQAARPGRARRAARGWRARRRGRRRRAGCLPSRRSSATRPMAARKRLGSGSTAPMTSSTSPR